MKDISLKISEILQLEIELNGLRSQDGTVVFNGLLSTKLPLVAKYWINELAETVGKEKKKVEELRNELIKKYGTEDESGNITIEIFTDEEKTQKNEKYTEFEKEYGALLAESKTLQYTPISLTHLQNVEISENYSMFFKFLQP